MSKHANQPNSTRGGEEEEEEEEEESAFLPPFLIAGMGEGDHE